MHPFRVSYILADQYFSSSDSFSEIVVLLSHLSISTSRWRESSLLASNTTIGVISWQHRRHYITELPVQLPQFSGLSVENKCTSHHLGSYRHLVSVNLSFSIWPNGPSGVNDLIPTPKKWVSCVGLICRPMLTYLFFAFFFSSEIHFFNFWLLIAFLYPALWVYWTRIHCWHIWFHINMRIWDQRGN